MTRLFQFSGSPEPQFNISTEHTQSTCQSLLPWYWRESLFIRIKFSLSPHCTDRGKVNGRQISPFSYLSKPHFRLFQDTEPSHSFPLPTMYIPPRSAFTPLHQLRSWLDCLTPPRIYFASFFLHRLWCLVRQFLLLSLIYPMHLSPQIVAVDGQKFTLHQCWCQGEQSSSNLN